MVAGLFLFTEPVMGYVIEPLVYGHSTGLSPLASGALLLSSECVRAWG